jgi:ribose transport system permease protein
MGKEQNPSLIRNILGQQEVGIFIALVGLITVFSALRPAFLSLENIASLLAVMAFIGIVSVGETLLVIGGDFDISVGSTAGLGAITSTSIMLGTSCFGLLGTGLEGLGVVLSCLASVLICACVGVINAFLIVKIKLSAFIATISTLYAVRGLVSVIAKGVIVYPLPQSFNNIYNIKIKLSSDSEAGIAISFMLFILFVIVFELLLRKSEFGRRIYATGSNASVARLAGINTDKVRALNFIITAMLAGFAGILVAGFLQQGYPSTGNMWELLVIASVVVGGVSMTGGRGSMIGMLIGVMLINVVNTGLVMLGFNTFAQNIVQGALIIAAVMVDTVVNNRKIRA